MNDEFRPGKNGGVVSFKQMALILAMLATIGTLHAVWVMPMILNRVSPKIDEAIMQYHSWHVQHVHPGAVTEKALEKTLEPVKMELRVINKHLEKIEKRMEK